MCVCERERERDTKPYIIFPQYQQLSSITGSLASLVCVYVCVEGGREIEKERERDNKRIETQRETHTEEESDIYTYIYI